MSAIPNDVLQVDGEILAGQVKELADLKKTVTEDNGKLRARLKSILESDGYPAKAMGMIRAIDEMSETTQADFLRGFVPMFQAMQENVWVSAPDLLTELEGEKKKK